MKRAYPERPCGDCGLPMKVVRKNQVRCAVCALGKAATWHDGRTADCPDCGQPYIAWTGTKSLPTCGRCFMARAPGGTRDAEEGECGHEARGTCLSHGNTVLLFHPRLRLCPPCLTDPDKFRLNKEAIVGRWHELTKTNPSTKVGSEERTK